MQNIGENLDFKKLVEEDRKKIVEKKIQSERNRKHQEAGSLRDQGRVSFRKLVNST